MKAVGAVGMFDGVHLGHQALVREVVGYARKLGHKAIIFTFDSHPLEVVKPEYAPMLLTTAAQKKRLLLQAGADEVVMLRFDHDMRQLTAEQFMQMLHRDYGLEVLVVGFNHRFGRDRVEGFEQYCEIGDRIGVRVEQADELVIKDIAMGISSSAIRKALLAGDIVTANAMLGREYSIIGNVSHGQGIGHTIGFPTANVEPQMKRQLIPQGGAYAGYAILPQMGVKRKAMVNIGTRPTITDGNAAPTIEANLIDFDGDIYGKEIEVRFVEKLRGEQKFSSLEALKSQLAADRQRTLSI